MTSIIVSVQKVAITIGTGATSATATINSVNAANSVIWWQGFTGSGTSSTYNVVLPQAVLTNATTVTASRNTSNSSTITVYATVVEFASSAVNSVQSGSITVASGAATGTATISSVTNGVCFYGGSTSNGGADNFISRQFGAVGLTSSTQVTAYRGVNPATTIAVPYTVVDFASGVVQSIQAFGNTLTSANASDNQAISSVNVDNTVIIYAGATLNSTGRNNTQDWAYNLSLTNSTTVAQTRAGTNTTGRSIYYTVLEFASGVLNAPVQRGTIALTSVTSNTATVSSVNTSYAVGNYTGFYQNQASVTLANGFAAVELTNGTTVTARVGASSATTFTAGYEVVEFAPPSSGTTGTGSPGESADTAAGSGAERFSGSGSAAESGDVAGSSGTNGHAGSGSAAESADAASASGGQAFSGSASPSETADTTSASGMAGIAGAGSVAETNDAATATGQQAYSGAAATTEGADVTSASGKQIFSGSGAATESADSTSAAGSLTFAGVSAAIESSDVTSASGSETFSGGASPAESGDTPSGSGTAGSGIIGTAAITEAAENATASGSERFSAVGGANESPDAATASGSTNLAGAAAIAESGDAASGSGSLRFAATAPVAESPDIAHGTGQADADARRTSGLNVLKIPADPRILLVRGEDRGLEIPYPGPLRLEVRREARVLAIPRETRMLTIAA